MKLYHYSTNRYDVLESLNARGMVKQGHSKNSDKSDPFAYNKHISFFLEPIPEDIASILKHEHKFWKSGTVLMEHVISLDAIPRDVHYKLVESYEHTDMIFNKQQWERVEHEPKLRTVYLKELSDMEQRLNYTGNSLDQMKKGLQNFKHNIRKDYENLYRLSKAYPESNMLAKYAASVPHLMIYLDRVRLKVDAINERRLK